MARQFERNKSKQSHTTDHSTPHHCELSQPPPNDKIVETHIKELFKNILKKNAKKQ